MESNSTSLRPTNILSNHTEFKKKYVVDNVATIK